MYVVWRKREGQHEDGYSARLLESVRVTGKPRQRVVAYLGGFKQWKLNWHRGQGTNRVAWYGDPRIKFWLICDERLDKLGLDAATRQRIEAQLVTMIPRLTSEERVAYEAWRDKA